MLCYVKSVGNKSRQMPDSAKTSGSNQISRCSSGKPDTKVMISVGIVGIVGIAIVCVIFGVVFLFLNPGNSPGKIANGGFAAESGDWIYYCNVSDGDKIYKMRTDRSDNQVVE